ncbi:unnamed protein product [Cyprideis torosa]|uniref:Uncharacterized protein n=1 Tax=Cyprideis torosa TaxID=163714 RepID=A0A7R8WFL0_9CRUS|nr:unnamed protein product [Cyprideis torosa]CAG0894247.1 unnamed protein product [Cyprideis torosa]
MMNNSKMEASTSSSKIFVGGLNLMTNEIGLKQYFSQFGTVENTHIKRDEQHRSKGFAVVSFSCPSDVEEVLAYDGDHFLDGHRIDPKRFDFDAYTGATHQEDDNCKMFVGGLNPITTEEDIKQYFGKYGTVRSVLLKRDPLTGKCRGFAFVVFGNAETAAQILHETQHVIKGKLVECKAFKGKPGKIFVGGIHRDCSVEDVKEYFCQFGLITEFVMPQDKERGTHKGYCFITYENENAARQCLQKDTRPVLKGKALDVKKAVPQEKQSEDGSASVALAGAGNMMYGQQPGAYATPPVMNHGPAMGSIPRPGVPRPGVRPRATFQNSAGNPGTGQGGCPYCGSSNPVINPPQLWPPIPQPQVPQQPTGQAMVSAANNHVGGYEAEMYDASSAMYGYGQPPAPNPSGAQGNMSQQFAGYGGYVNAVPGPVANIRGRGRGMPARGLGVRPKPY